MAFIPTANGIRAALLMQLQGQLCVNTFWFRKGSGTIADELVATVDLLEEWFSVNYADVLPSILTLTNITARDASVAAGLGIDRSESFTGNMSGSTVLPNNITLAVAHRTGYTNRSARGRTYIPGITLNATTGNYITPAYHDAVIEAFDALLALQIPTGQQWSVCSFYHDLAPRPAGVMVSITNNTCNLTLDSQRRRLPERGA